jgi:hypothetical protein
MQESNHNATDDNPRVEAWLLGPTLACYVGGVGQIGISRPVVGWLVVRRGLPV